VNAENCDVVVGNAWKLTMEAREGKVASAVREVAAELQDWSRNFLGDLEERIKKAKFELEKCRKHGISRDSVTMEEILNTALKKWRINMNYTGSNVLQHTG